MSYVAVAGHPSDGFINFFENFLLGYNPFIEQRLEESTGTIVPAPQDYFAPHEANFTEGFQCSSAYFFVELAHGFLRVLLSRPKTAFNLVEQVDLVK